MKKNNTSYGNQTIGSATDSLQSGITSNDVFVTPPKYRKGSSEPLNNYSEGIELTEGFKLNTTLRLKHMITGQTTPKLENRLGMRRTPQQNRHSIGFREKCRVVPVFYSGLC